jgi:hypothetical protein
VQSREDTVGAEHAGQQVSDRDADLHRFIGARAGQAHHPGLPLRDLVVAGAVALRAVVAEPRDRQDHEPRVDPVQLLRREPESVEHPGAEVLHQYVGLGRQPAQERLPFVALEVGGDRLLVAVGAHEVRRLGGVLGTHERRSPAAAVVAGCGGLDLDDAGAEVAQHHRGMWSGQRSSQVDDDDVTQQGGHSPTLRCSRSVVVGSSCPLVRNDRLTLLDLAAGQPRAGLHTIP